MKRGDKVGIILASLLAFYIFFPLGVMILESLATQWYRIQKWWAPEKVGIKWYVQVFQTPEIFKAIWMTFVIAITVAVFVILLNLLPAYVIGTGKIKFGRDFFETFGSIPQTVPAVALGVGMLPVYSRLGWLYTFHGIVLAHSVGAVPYVFRNLTNGFASIDPELEEAAKVFGAKGLTIIRKVYLPLLKPYLAAAGVLAFAWSINEFVLTMLLGYPTIATIAVKVYQNAGGYYWAPHLAGALSTLLVVPSLILVFLLEKYTGISLQRV